MAKAPRVAVGSDTTEGKSVAHVVKVAWYSRAITIRCTADVQNPDFREAVVCANLLADVIRA